MKPILTLAYAISLTLMINTSVIAQENDSNFSSKTPTSDELKNSLKIKLRTIQVVGGTTKILPPTPVEVNLSLPFKFDSAILTQEAKTTLDALGIALNKKELSPFIFGIEGHTDAIGEARYNSSLSQQRADAVKNYLANNFSVSTTRLKAVGKGETELFDPKHPGASINRRVTIINTGLKTK